MTRWHRPCCRGLPVLSAFTYPQPRHKRIADQIGASQLRLFSTHLFRPLKFLDQLWDRYRWQRCDLHRAPRAEIYGKVSDGRIVGRVDDGDEIVRAQQRSTLQPNSLISRLTSSMRSGWACNVCPPSAVSVVSRTYVGMMLLPVLGRPRGLSCLTTLRCLWRRPPQSAGRIVPGLNQR